MNLARAKTVRCLRRVPMVALKRFVEPVFDAGQILTFAAAIVGLTIILHNATDAERDMQATQWAIATEAFAIALLGWAIISLVCAPFLVIRDDRRNGSWDGHHFIYHQRILARTLRVVADNGGFQSFPITFGDAEPNAFVYYDIDRTPHGMDRIRTMMIPGVRHSVALDASSVWQNITGIAGCRLNGQRQATLIVAIEPSTVPVVIRIFCHSFFVGRSEENA